MKPSRNLLFLMLLSSIALSGCVNYGNTSIESATTASVAAELSIGQTTKAEVEATYGSPSAERYAIACFERRCHFFTARPLP